MAEIELKNQFQQIEDNFNKAVFQTTLKKLKNV
jgi:hypothetical protein